MEKGKVSPNIMSLTDTALTLIVAFMVTLPAINWQGMNIETKASSKSAYSENTEELLRAEVIIITVSQDILLINGSYTSKEYLKDELRKHFKALNTREVIIDPDSDVILERVISVFDIVKSAGAKSLSLLEGN